MIKKLLIAILLVFIFPSLAFAVSAFDGAMGFGASTKHAYQGNGRETDTPDLYIVNTLTFDSGATYYGTGKCPAVDADTCCDEVADEAGGCDYIIYQSGLEDALESSGDRIVLFEVEGIINMGSGALRVEDPYIFVAGETAPGKGIMVRGGPLYIETHDAVFRHIRVRPGDESGEACRNSPSACDGLLIDNYDTTSDVYNIVVDHCSFSWSMDEVASVYSQGNANNTNIYNVTLSNSIFSEPLDDSYHSKGAHGYNMMIGTSSGVSNTVTKVSILRNLLAHSDYRNPFLDSHVGTIFVNNMVYNWDEGTGKAGTIEGINRATPNGEVTFEGNVWKKGLETSAPDHFLYIWGNLSNADDLNVYVQDNLLDETTGETLYEDGTAFNGINSALGSPDYTQSGSRVPTFPSGDEEITILTSEAAWATIANSVGAFPNNRTAYDASMITDVNNRTGYIIDSVSEAGGWPTYDSNTHTLTIPSNPHSVSATGRTNLEDWVSTSYAKTANVEGAPPEEGSSGTYYVAQDACGSGDDSGYSVSGCTSFAVFESGVSPFDNLDNDVVYFLDTITSAVTDIPDGGADADNIVTLRGDYAGRSAVFIVTGETAITIKKSFVTLKNFTINGGVGTTTNNDYEGIYIAFNGANTTNVTIDGLTIQNQDGSGVEVSTVADYYADTIVVKNSVIKDNANGGALLRNCKNSTIGPNNTITRNINDTSSTAWVTLVGGRDSVKSTNWTDASEGTCEADETCYASETETVIAVWAKGWLTEIGEGSGENCHTNVDAQNEWCYDDVNDKVWVRGPSGIDLDGDSAHFVHRWGTLNRIYENNIYDNNGSQSSDGWGAGAENASSGVSIYRNWISGNVSGLQPCWGSKNCVASENIIANNDGTAIRVHHSGTTNAPARIYNNTVYNNGSGSAGYGLYVGNYSNAIVKNNIIYHDAASYDYTALIGFYLVEYTGSNNNYYPESAGFLKAEGTEYDTVASGATNYVSGFGDESSSIGTDPQFIDVDSDEYWCMPKSGVRGAGVAITGYNDRLDKNNTWPGTVNTVTEPDTIGAYQILPANIGAAISGGSCCN